MARTRKVKGSSRGSVAHNIPSRNPGHFDAQGNSRVYWERVNSYIQDFNHLNRLKE